ncbi:TMEM175 family protein [Flavobacterium sp.]|uniref:TMEM175 family protein n=1 Tax=Flavobacterium sp. TaxID=239 RepID=UPI002B4B08F3|nr:TMEM175 family protein [Flavobacterium sp.]HLF51432.1 TMEM175 family protein [Flavobacterium sp.]
MNKTRLEAFSDGVLAIIITIMVLEIKVPEGGNFSSLLELYPVFLSYILSFIYIAIYWNNHHHMLQSASKTNGKILWANLHLLFWLSLIPFTSGWMGENHFAKATMTLYGVVLFMAAIAYWILQNQIIASEGENNILAKAVGKNFKGKASPVLYFIAILFSFYNEWISGAIYILVALIWLVPNKRIEIIINSEKNN